MRMFGQDRAFYRRVGVDETDDADGRRRLRIVEGIEEMRVRFPADAACGASGCRGRRTTSGGGV